MEIDGPRCKLLAKMVEITMRQRLLGSVLHAGAALDLFTTEQHEWGTTEIAEALALPKSSAHALLASLTEIGLLERTPTSVLDTSCSGSAKPCRQGARFS